MVSGNETHYRAGRCKCAILPNQERRSIEDFILRSLIILMARFQVKVYV